MTVSKFLGNSEGLRRDLLAQTLIPPSRQTQPLKQKIMKESKEWLVVTLVILGVLGWLTFTMI